MREVSHVGQVHTPVRFDEFSTLRGHRRSPPPRYESYLNRAHDCRNGSNGSAGMKAEAAALPEI